MKYKILFFFILGIIACKNNESPVNNSNEIDETLIYSFTYNGKLYEVIKQAKIWESAATIAIDSGGYLVEINDIDEQNNVFLELINNADIIFDETLNRFGFGAVWIGGNDINLEGNWIWDGDNDGIGESFWSGAVDGNSVNNLYNNWGNEPDNNGEQDVLCIGLEATPINEAGLWTDLNGDLNSLFFVVEYDQ